jgi:SAM-dependent methyltransferase
MAKFDRAVYLMDDPAEAQRLVDKVDAPAWVKHYYAPRLDPYSNILSVGCGPGHFLDAIAQLYPLATVTGVDVSEARVADARARNARNRNVVVQQSDIHQIGLSDASFDFIEARFLFEYLKNKQRAMEELVRVCRPGGVICLQDLDGQLVSHYPHDGRVQAVQRIIEQLAYTGFDVFTGRKLFALAKGAGLIDLDVRIDAYHVVAGTIDAFNFELWSRKLKIAEPMLSAVCGSAAKAQGMIAGFLDYLRDDETLTYSTLFTVIGRKPTRCAQPGEQVSHRGCQTWQDSCDRSMHGP